MTAKMATIVGDVTGPPAVPTPIKYTSSCREDQRLSTEDKLVSQLLQRIKNSRGDSSHQHPPFPRAPCTLYHGGGMNLHVHLRVKRQLKRLGKLSQNLYGTPTGKGRPKPTYTVLDVLFEVIHWKFCLLGLVNGC